MVSLECVFRHRKRGLALLKGHNRLLELPYLVLGCIQLLEQIGVFSDDSERYLEQIERILRLLNLKGVFIRYKLSLTFIALLHNGLECLHFLVLESELVLEFMLFESCVL